MENVIKLNFINFKCISLNNSRREFNAVDPLSAEILLDVFFTKKNINTRID